MKEIIKTAAVAIIFVLALVAVVLTRGDDTTDWSKFNINVAAQQEEFSYEIVASNFNGTYSHNTRHKLYAMVGKNTDDTYRLYFVKDMGKIRTVILRIDDLSLNQDMVGKFSVQNMGEGSIAKSISTVSSLNIVFYDGATPQLRVYTENQAGSNELIGSYSFYRSMARFSLNNATFAD